MSLGLALMLGTAGLPHILMRFYTVPDARTARVSVAYATAFIGFFYLLTFILGFGAMVLVGQRRDPRGRPRRQHGGAAAGRGGRRHAFLGFIAAVAFATILAVVAGLTLAGAAALSHDLWVNVVRAGPRDRARAAARGARRHHPAGGLSIVLGIAFKGQNVAYMVGLAFAIAASANFPALVLSMFGGRLPTRGAQLSILVGTVSTLVLIYLSPTIQIDVLASDRAFERSFPYRNPGLFTIPLSFVVGIVTSLLAPEPAASEGFDRLEHQIHVGEEEPAPIQQPWSRSYSLRFVAVASDRRRRALPVFLRARGGRRRSCGTRCRRRSGRGSISTSARRRSAPSRWCRRRSCWWSACRSSGPLLLAPSP